MTSRSVSDWHTDAFGPFRHHRKRVAFIERLPPELLSQIFEAGCVPFESTLNNTSFFDSRSTGGLSSFDVFDEEEESDNNNGDEGQHQLHSLGIPELPASLEGNISEQTVESSDPWWDPYGSDGDSIELAMDRECRTRKRLVTQDFQTLVSHVCRRWREAAIANPVLWNRIAILHPSRNYDWLQVWTKRSQQAKLDIFLDMRLKLILEKGRKSKKHRRNRERSHTSQPPDIVMFRKEHLETIFVTLMPEIRRWRTLDLRTRTSKLMEYTLRKIKSKAAPQLETLHLGVLNQSGPPSSLYGILKGGAPSLKVVRLRSTFIPWAGNPFRGLVSLLICDVKNLVNKITLDHFVLLLKKNTSLVNLVMHSSGPNTEIQSTSGINAVRLENLKLLDIVWEEATGQLSTLLQHIQAPNLSAFILNCTTVDIDKSDWKQGLGIVGSSFKTITNLELSGYGKWDDQSLFNNVLRSLAALETLRLAPSLGFDDRLPLPGCGEKPILPRGLSPLMSSQVCPRLATLYVEGIPLDTVLAIAKGRMESGKRLKALYHHKPGIFWMNLELVEIDIWVELKQYVDYISLDNPEGGGMVKLLS